MFNLKYLTLCSLFVVSLPGLLSAKIAIKQDFQSFSVGQIPTEGIGSLTDANGLWQPKSYASTGDPSIQVEPDDPNNKCLRISYGSGNKNTKALSNFAPISENEPFVLSWSQYFKQQAGVYDVGSTYIYADANAVLTPANPPKGIYFTNYTQGGLFYWSGPLDREAQGNGSPADCNDKWVDFKLHVKTWDAGDGFGLFDVYWKRHGTKTSSDIWNRIEYDWRFNSTGMHDGLNAMYFVPRKISGIVNYFDEVSIATEPVDCQSMIILGQNFSGDMTGDCRVDYDDMYAMAVSWLDSSNTTDEPLWNIGKWDANEVPDTTSLGIRRWHWTPPYAYTATAADGICHIEDVTDPTKAVYIRTDFNFNSKIPTLTETRFKMVDNINYLAGIIVADAQYGYCQFYLYPYYFRSTNPYADGNGFIRMRILTSVKNGHLNEAILYWQNENTNKWDKIVTAPCATDVFAAAGQTVDVIGLGDFSGSWFGDYYYDYMYISQDSATVTNFIKSIDAQGKDINGNGRVDFIDFAEMASQWLLSY